METMVIIRGMGKEMIDSADTRIIGWAIIIICAFFLSAWILRDKITQMFNGGGSHL